MPHHFVVPTHQLGETGRDPFASFGAKVDEKRSSWHGLRLIDLWFHSRIIAETAALMCPIRWLI